MYHAIAYSPIASAVPKIAYFSRTFAVVSHPFVGFWTILAKHGLIMKRS